MDDCFDYEELRVDMIDSHAAQAVTRVLEAMGTTPTEVADTLRAAGIKGVQASCSTCPIAMYLQRHHWGDLELVFSSVGQSKAFFRLPVEVVDGVVVMANIAADVPRPVGELIRAFDTGSRFQDLAA